MIDALDDGLRCVVADIDFCASKSRREAEDTLRAEVPGASIEWRFFANEVEVCEDNIRRRNRCSLPEELSKLHAYSRCYEIPDNAQVLQCFRALCHNR